jgi:hypothetical protein
VRQPAMMIPRKAVPCVSGQKSWLDGIAGQKAETVGEGTALLVGKRGELIFTALDEPLNCLQ